MPPLSPALGVLLWQASLVLFCLLEESFQLPSPPHSRTLAGLVSFVLGIFISVLRLPVRILVLFGLCPASRLQEFGRVVPGAIEFLNLHTEEDLRIRTQLKTTREELKRERLYTVQQNRIQADLDRVRADRTRYQRESVTLQVQRDELVAQKAQLSHALSETQRELAEASKRMEETTTKLCRSEELRSWTQLSLQDVTEARRQLDRDLFRAQSEALDSRQSLRHEQSVSRSRFNKQTELLRRVLYVFWIMHCFCRHLGSRVATKEKIIHNLRGQFRALRDARINAVRETALYQRRNTELVAQVEFLGGEADRWRIRSHEHRTRRQAAAKQFTQFLILVASRRSTANSRLITGLMTLWRLNLLLSEKLARATLRVRTLNRWPALGGTLDGPEIGVRRMDVGTQCCGDALVSEANAVQVPEPGSPFAERSELGAEWTWNELLPVSLGPCHSDPVVQSEDLREPPERVHAAAQCDSFAASHPAKPSVTQSSDVAIQCDISRPVTPDSLRNLIDSAKTPIPPAAARVAPSPTMSDSTSMAGADDNNIDDLYEDVAGLDDPPLMTFGSFPHIEALAETDETLESLETISSFSPNGPLSTIAEEEELAMSDVGSVSSPGASRDTRAMEHPAISNWFHVASFDAEVDAALRDASRTPVGVFGQPLPRMQQNPYSTPPRYVAQKTGPTDNKPRSLFVQKAIQTDPTSGDPILTARLQYLWEKIHAMQSWDQEYRQLALTCTHPTTAPPDVVFGTNMVLPPKTNPGSVFDDNSEPMRLWSNTSSSSHTRDDQHPVGAHLVDDPNRTLQSSIHAHSA